jgi:hypothetical protein
VIEDRRLLCSSASGGVALSTTERLQSSARRSCRLCRIGGVFFLVGSGDFSARAPVVGLLCLQGSDCSLQRGVLAGSTVSRVFFVSQGIEDRKTGASGGAALSTTPARVLYTKVTFQSLAIDLLQPSFCRPCASTATKLLLVTVLCSPCQPNHYLHWVSARWQSIGVSQPRSM